MSKRFTITNLSKVGTGPSINILPYVMLNLTFINKGAYIADGIAFKPGAKVIFSFGWLFWDFQISNL